MTPPRFDDARRLNGCRVLRIESDALVIEVLPEVGGKIYRWFHKPEERDWIWTHPRIPPAILPRGTDYDDHWCGGWDELFPCGGPGVHAGVEYPDHGEYWTAPCGWDVRRDGDALTLHLSATGGVTPTRWERWMTVRQGSSAVRFRHRITHHGPRDLDFLWALHPALAVRPGCRLLVPATEGVIGSPGGGRLAEAGGRFQWPLTPGRDGDAFDSSLVPQGVVEHGFEMLYLDRLQAGWWALHDPTTRSGFGMAFDQRLFDTVWVFQTNGGWRGLHVAILEPCTGHPYDLAEAAAQGRCGRLAAGATLDTESTAVVYTGRDAVGTIAADGTVG